MADRSKITLAEAEKVWENVSHESQGTVVIDGETFEWWSDVKSLWFYEPGKDGEDTLVRYEAELCWSEG
jgi:hypothetical protein